MQKNKILIIDDDIELARTLRAVLEGQGFAVHLAEDSEEGIALARAVHPDLILLDVMMRTAGEGFAAAQVLKGDASLAAIPIIMLTAVKEETGFSFNPREDKDFLPVERFLDKPVDPKKLIEEIRSLIG
jgi:CheY-like chemotaxis protein